MSIVLRRPMFRGGRVRKSNGGVMDIYESISEKIPMPERREPRALTTGDYLRIASAGLDILGRPSEGGGFKGALATVSKPLAELGVDIGESIDRREAKSLEDLREAQKERKEKIAALTGAQVEMDVGMAKAQGEFARKLRALEAVYEVKREGINNNAELDEATKKKQLSDLDIQFNTDKEYYLIKGGDVSDFFKLGSQGELIKAANRAAKKQIKQEGIGPDSPNYLTRLAELQAQYLAIMTQQFGKQFAEGGAVTTDVNMMTATPKGITDVNVEEMSTTQPKQNLPQLSYDEIRARLPKEISDDIVTLLANSYEALADFAEIRTQADVDAFNLKYQVQLVLPQEA
mgnify:FL=1